MSNFQIENYNNKVCIITPSSSSEGDWLGQNCPFVDLGQKFAEERFQCLFHRLSEVQTALGKNNKSWSEVLITPEGV